MFRYINRLPAIFLYACTLFSLQANGKDTLSIETIDQYLVDIEAPFSDLVKGAERAVRWHDEKRQTDLAIVYLHGFSASRREISPVTELLADRLQANVYYARLRGHGRSEQAMAEASVEDWIADVRAAYRIGQIIGKKIILVSTSTGGTLATWLNAQKNTDDIIANIMISPNFGLANRAGEIVRWSWGLTLAKWINGSHHEFQPMNDYHRRYWTERYPMEALVPMMKIVDQVRELNKSHIRTPQLIVYSPDDKVINVDAVSKLAKQFTAAAVSLVPFTQSGDPSQHVLAGDACSPGSTAAMVSLLSDFLQAL